MDEVKGHGHIVGQKPIDSHPFIPCQSAIPFLGYLCFKYDLENLRSRSWVRSKFKVAKWARFPNYSHPFPPCQSAIRFLGYSFFKIWHWKSKDKVIAQGHIVGPTPYWLTSLSFHVNQPSHSWDMAISTYDLENPRSKSRSHNPSSIWCISFFFYVNRPNQSAMIWPIQM